MSRFFCLDKVGHHNRTISCPLVEALRQTDVRVAIDILRPGTYKTLENHLREIAGKHGTGYYHVLHFDLHGSLLNYEQWQDLLHSEKKEPESHSHTYQQYYALKDIEPYTGERKPSCFLKVSRTTRSHLLRLQPWRICCASIPFLSPFLMPASRASRWAIARPAWAAA